MKLHLIPGLLALTITSAQAQMGFAEAIAQNSPHIAAYCKDKWEFNHSMRGACYENQRDALRWLSSAYANTTRTVRLYASSAGIDLTEKDRLVGELISTCSDKWQVTDEQFDFAMIRACVQNQFEAWLSLKKKTAPPPVEKPPDWFLNLVPR